MLFDRDFALRSRKPSSGVVNTLTIETAAGKHKGKLNVAIVGAGPKAVDDALVRAIQEGGEPVKITAPKQAHGAGVTNTPALPYAVPVLREVLANHFAASLDEALPYPDAVLTDEEEATATPAPKKRGKRGKGAEAAPAEGETAAA